MEPDFVDSPATLAALCASPLQHLLSMGVKVAFDEKVANFKKLSDDPLFISDVLQSVSHFAAHTSVCKLWLVSSIDASRCHSGCTAGSIIFHHLFAVSVSMLS